MQHQDDKKIASRPNATASSAVSISAKQNNQKQLRHQSHRSHRQILRGDEICSRFDQISGQNLPKRMTTGKFVYLGPSDKTLDSPL